MALKQTLNRIPIGWLMLATLIAFAPGAFAASKTFTGPGNFSNAALWTGGTLPVAADKLRINGSAVYDVTTNLAYGYLRVGRNSAGTLTWSVGSTAVLQATYVYSSFAGSSINMTNGGVLQINTTAAMAKTPWVTTNMTFVPGAGTVVWNVNYAQPLPATIPTYNNLTISSTGTIATSLAAATTLTGNLLISSGALNAGAFALNVAGNFTNNSTFTAGTGTVTLNGAAAQTVTGTNVFNNLTLSNAVGVTFSGNNTVNGVFTPGTTPITVPAGSTLKIGATTYTGPCSGVYSASYCAPTASGFNAFETTTAANATTGVIQTKIAGAPFTVSVVALTAVPAVQTTFTGGVKLELVNATTGVACNAAPLIQNIGTLTFAVADAGRKTTANITAPNAWQNVRVRMSYPATGTATTVACSTDNFAIRPNSFANLAVTDASWTTAGTTRVLGNVTQDASQGCSDAVTTAGCNTTTRVIHKAGQPFTLTATAVNAAATPVTTSNYTGTPIAILTPCVGTACSATFGALNVGAAAVAGVINSAAATYSDVGAFSLQLQDQTFSNVDAADGSTTAQRYINSGVINVGRFVPDHFAITAGAVTPGNTGFTYFGQDGFTTSFTLTAQNVANAVTQNYGGVGLATWSSFAFSTGALPAGAALSSSATAPSITWTNGIASVTAKHQISRPTNPAAITNVTVSAKPVDGDGVTMVSAVAVHAASTPMYYGQIKVSNALGSELKPLLASATVQYCNAVSGITCSNWRSNTLDTLTGLSTPYLTFSNPNPTTLTVTAGAPTVISQGLIGLKISDTTQIKGTIDMAAKGPTWLPNAAPARATFGIYDGAKQFIYMRENY